MLLNKMKNFVKREAHIRQTRRELFSLSDRDLADIGINRADIENIARDQWKNVI